MVGDGPSVESAVGLFSACNTYCLRSVRTIDLVAQRAIAVHGRSSSADAAVTPLLPRPSTTR